MNYKELMLLAKAIPQPTEYTKIEDIEYSVFSQWGDDGIIQYLVNYLNISNHTFVEFGVENYLESNTRFLMMNNNWKGLVLDGSKKHIATIKNSEYYWKYDLVAIDAFVTIENITNLILSNIDGKIGLLHIDLDGMDYWIWQEISKSIKPEIVILEYNSIFGRELKVTVPYDMNFKRFKAHHSGLYAGASLSALVDLSNERGYAFIGSNSAGNNAYFVKRELLNDKIKELTVEKGYRLSKFRESRNKKGELTFLRGKERIDEIRGMPVINTETNKIEKL